MCFSFFPESESSNAVKSSQRSKITAQINAQMSNKLPVPSSLPPTNDRNASSNDLTSPRLSDVTSSPVKLEASVIQQKPFRDKPKKSSLLNTYSSEELLLQAANSLQGLEGKNKSCNYYILFSSKLTFTEYSKLMQNPLSFSYFR